MQNDTDPKAPLAPEASATPNQSIFVAPQPPKKSKKGLIIALSSAVVAVLLIVAAILVYNLVYQNPQKVVHDAVVNAIKAKTATLSGQITFAQETTDAKADVKVSLDTASNEKADGSAKAAVDIRLTPTQGAGESLKLSATGEFRLIGETAYIKIDNVRDSIEEVMMYSGQAGEVPAQLDAIVSKIDGQWISIAPSDYEEDSKEASAAQKCLAKVGADFSSDKTMQKEIIDLYKKNTILKVEDSLGSKDINGTGSLGYRVTADEDATREFIKGVADTEYGKRLHSCDESIDLSSIADDITNVSESTNSVESSEVELWVSRFGHHITQLNTTTTYKADGSVVSQKLTSELRPVFNKAVTVEEPKDAVSLKDLLADLEKVYSSYAPSVSSSAYDDYEYDYSASSSLSI